ncbi:MAG: GntR family transcriptional regulator [Steroidobacteraceae bacterium]
MEDSSIDVAEAVRIIREGIHIGRFVPGQRLVEADLMQEFGVSRGRIREAFRRLEADRLVEIEKNKGASVRRISRKEVLDTLEVLHAISRLITERVVAVAADPTARTRIRASLKAAGRFRRQLTQIDQSRQYMNENARFWDVLTDLCDNSVLSDTRIRLETTLFRLALEGSRITARKDQWITRHEDILQAILKRDKQQALKLVGESVDEVRDAMLMLPDIAFLISDETTRPAAGRRARRA